MAEQPSNPLQMGQTLYEALDATILATPVGGSHTSYTQVVFASQGGSRGDSAELVLDKHPILDGDILDARAALDMHSALRKAFVLTANKLVQIGHTASGAELAGWSLENSGMSCIVGFDPHDISSSTLLLAGSDKQGCRLLAFDCTHGKAGGTTTLPGISGALLGAVLVRCQLDAHLLILTANAGKLVINDVGAGPWRTQSLTAPLVTTISLDDCDSSQSVSHDVASMISGTSNQQLVLSYAGSGGCCHVAVVGFDDNGGLTVLATAAPKLFADAERPAYRVAAGDLMVSGIDLLVVGYPAVYGNVRGCAALLLFELKKVDTSFALCLISNYAGAQSGGQALASIDLHIAAGMFGSANDTSNAPSGQLGVVVLGACATAQQLFHGQASVCSALIPVDPIRKSFPLIAPGKPDVPQYMKTVASISPTADRFFGFPSDVTGLSVVLGTPTLSQAIGAQQLLAIVQAPPFQNDDLVCSGKPLLTMQRNASITTSYNVSSNKTWMVSKDAGATLGIGSQQLEKNARKSWGKSFDNIKDKSITKTVQVSIGLIENDMLMIYGMNYYVWTYPVRRLSRTDETAGSMAVIFPASPKPVQTYTPANHKDYGYTPKSQNGMLLSYLNLPHDGLTATGKEMLFTLISLPVTQDPQSSSVTFDENKANLETATTSYNVENSTGGSGHFTASTTLLNYLPVSFGLNLSESSSYSEHDAQTTTLSNTVGMSVTIALGDVSDITYGYQVTPYIYQHNELGCLMIGYDVSLSGQKWQKYFGKPQARMIAPYGVTNDAMLAAFSRSITFNKKNDDSVDICVSVFNNSLVAAKNVICSWYLGEPDEDMNPPTTVLGKTQIDLIGPAARVALECNAKFSSATQIITVQLETPISGTGLATGDDDSPNGDLMDTRVYWGIYPPEAFAAWTPSCER